MRVLLVAAATSTTGGGERHVADLVRCLPARGVGLGLVAPSGGDLSVVAARHGVPFYRADIAGSLSLAGCRQLRAAITAFQPEVVHAHGSRAAFYARLADRSAAARVIYTLHGIHVDRAGSALRQRVLLAAERHLRPRTARFVTVCEADMRKGAQLGVLDPGLTTTVYNGIDVPKDTPARGGFRAELGLGDDVPLVLSVGRFQEPKDQATLLRAWALVHARVPQAVLGLIGGGPLEDELHALAASLQLGASARFLGSRPSVASAYADADVFALSSRWEGLPYVVLEAMAYALPVVSTAVDGIPEAVTGGENGLLVPPSDPQALGEAIVGMLADRDAARVMGQIGRARVARDFTLAHMADRLRDVYAGLLDHQPGS